MTTRNLKIDLTPGGAPQVVRVSQYDNGARRLLVSLTDGDKGAFTIPAGATVKVDGTKPSGKGFSDACTISDNQVTVVIKDTMTDEPGRVRCELVLTKDSARLGSAKFELDVERGALSPEAIIESDTFEGIIKDAVRECANEQLIELIVDQELSNESDNPVANKVVSNLFASALKGSVYGSEVTADDISPVKHNLKVRAYGKNLCTPNALDTMASNGTVNDYDPETHTITMRADSTGYSGRYASPSRKLVPGRVYTVSFDLRGTTGKRARVGWDKDSDFVILTESYVRHSHAFVVTKASEPIIFYTNTSNGGLASGEYMQFANVQIELSDTATDYEPYVDPSTLRVTAGGKTFTPDSSGNVEGLTSDMLTGGISVNNGGIVDCEYNRDLTKVIAKIEAALFN